MLRGQDDYRLRNQKNNFWLPGNYKNVLKRLKLGALMTSNLISYMKERVDVETSSQQKLQRWLFKWKGGVSIEEDEGMLLTVLKLLNHSQEQHFKAIRRLKSAVNGVIVPKLRVYKRYVKTKGVKEISKDFERVQKPWNAAMKKLEKIKIIYHEACRATYNANETLQSNTVPTGHGTAEMTPELREKIQRRFNEYQVEVDRCRNVYEATLYELNFLKSQYKEAMQSIFEKCVSIERERLICFRECLELFAKALDVGRETQCLIAWHEVDKCINSYTVDEDLNVFSTTVGPDMPYVWPHFEEWHNRPSQLYYD